MYYIMILIKSNAKIKKEKTVRIILIQNVAK